MCVELWLYWGLFIRKLFSSMWYQFLQTQFDITVASEIMAILALTTDLRDMRKRY